MIILRLFSLCLLACCLLTNSSSFAQLDNTSFYKFEHDTLSNYSKLDLEIDYLGFFRNREYFGNIADGYTLFGSQLMTKVNYQFDANFQLSVGGFLRKDFGNSNFTQLQPYFQFLYQKNNHQFIFGNLEGNLEHGLIEPLFAFENIIQRRLENGVQYRYLAPKTFLDVWVDWVTMIYEGSDFDEELHFGLHLDKAIFQNQKWRLSIPVQATAIHRGGQINTTDTPIQTVFNTALGSRIDYSFDENSFIQKLRFDNYGVFFLDNSSENIFPFDNGQGFYSNFSLVSKKVELMLSYWRAQDYVNPLGGAIYSSVSRRFDALPNEIEASREFLMLRVLSNFELNKATRIVFRASPFYNFNTQKLQFSTGLYAVFNTHFLLKDFR